VGVEAHQDRVRDSEHLLDLVAHRVEHTGRHRTFGDERGHAS